ncbi:MAG TPA: M20/M25/M40 family metallo-hydrolase [Pirellulales bacterium]|nr:M20/M25/M40 family metallo-hydrolase [Pirellulales bacterium]
MEKLLKLASLLGPTGDEGAVADWLAAETGAMADATLVRIGDNLIVARGAPRTAIFAHTDTTGYTLGYHRQLIPIGAPAGRDGDRLRSSDGLCGRLRASPEGGPLCRLRKVRNAAGEKVEPTPGSRWTYARQPEIKSGVVRSPYLDNRAGVWAALRALEECKHIAVAFCTGEEHHGHGARVCADWLYGQLGIAQALIADITWHTRETPCGKGVVISLRDAFTPRQAFLDRVLALADTSQIPHQREIQSSGSSDGGHLLRSSVPLDWVFVGAPEKAAHSACERAAVADLEAMAELLAYLVDRLD